MKPDEDERRTKDETEVGDERKCGTREVTDEYERRTKDETEVGDERKCGTREVTDEDGTEGRPEEGSEESGEVQ